MGRLSLSVAMCTYNGARFLPEQLDSIAAQTRLPDELVVCDDASTDETVGMLYSFARKVPFEVRLEVNERNLGSTKNFEKAIGKCAGEIIALADQDDVWLPEKLGLIESIFLSKRAIGVVFSDADVMGENGVSLEFRLWASMGFSPALQKGISNGRGTQVLLNHNVVTGAAMAFRTEFRNFVLPISTKWMHDGWIALLTSVVADLALIPEPLIRYRKHSGQQAGPGPYGFTERFARSRETGSEEYSALVAQFAAARERLLTLEDDSRFKAVISQFDTKIKHLETRAQMNMQRKRTSRLARVVGELLSGRYHRYSAGWKSAAKDFLL